MSTKEALVEEYVSVKPDETAAVAIRRLQEHNIRCMPVVDDENNLLGLFCFRSLISSLLPSGVPKEDETNRLNFLMETTPHVVDKLLEMRPKSVSELMDKDIRVAHIDTPAWEVLRLLYLYGSPIPVVERGSAKLVGLISEQSMQKMLQKNAADRT